MRGRKHKCSTVYRESIVARVFLDGELLGRESRAQNQQNTHPARRHTATGACTYYGHGRTQDEFVFIPQVQRADSSQRRLAGRFSHNFQSRGCAREERRQLRPTEAAFEQREDGAGRVIWCESPSISRS